MMQSSGEQENYDFVLSSENRSFTNVSTTAIDNSFTDVPKDAWFYNSVTSAADKGWIKGIGDRLFAPENTISAAEWITLLSRVAGEDSADGNEWYARAAEWGTENKIINSSEWVFSADSPLLREQMADMIWKFASYLGLDMSTNGNLSAFSDADIISDYAKEAFSWAAEKGIIKGDENGLRPKDNLSRAEAAEILMNLSNITEISKKSTEIYPVSVKSELYTEFSESTSDYFPDGFQTGFGSGITFKGYDENGNPQFYGVTDRGPSLDLTDLNDETIDDVKVFPSPDFTPSIGIITIKDGKAVIEKSIKLKNEDGSLMTGLPLPAGESGSTGEIALDIYMNELSYDEKGFDPEGIAIDSDGNFWIADEYGPFIGKFSSDGTLIKMYSPGNGLPEILKSRIANRGFEGISVSPSGKVFASVQSVLDINGETSKTSTFIRIIELDPATGETKTYAYPVNSDEYSSPKNCKIGDIYAIDDENILLIEQGTLSNGEMRNIIYKVSLKDASDISNLKYNDKDLEYTASQEELEKILTFADKEIYVDLRTLGWTAEKAEGLCMTDNGELAVIIEDDFGLAGAKMTEDSDKVTLISGEGGDSAQLWIIK